MPVDENVVEHHAFALEGLQHEVVDRPEGAFRESVCAQAVLVGDHHELEVELLAYESQVSYGSVYKLELVERVDLLIRRLLYYGAVAVDE